MSSNHPAEYFCTVRREARRDGVHYWHWEVTDNRGWPIISGVEYSSRTDALEKARAASTAYRTKVDTPGRKAS